MDQENEQSLDHSALSPEGQGSEKVVTESVSEAQSSTAADELPDSFWQDFDNYYNRLNGLMASRENLKLVAMEKKIKKQYYRKWSTEADAFFTLLVALKRRRATIKKYR